MPLQTLSPDSTTESIVQAMEDDGAAIITNVIPDEFIHRLVAQLTPYIERTPMGRDDFTGRQTQRTGALVARTPLCRELVADSTILDAQPVPFSLLSPNGSSCI